MHFVNLYALPGAVTIVLLLLISSDQSTATPAPAGTSSIDDATATPDNQPQREFASRLPEVTWEEVLPGKMLPVVDQSIEELRTSFGNEEGRGQLLELLTDDDHWITAHVVLSSLYRKDRSASSQFHSLYRSSREGLATRVEYNGLSLVVKYVDDGFCIVKTIEASPHQRPRLIADWESWFRLAPERRIVDLTESRERTASDRWSMLISNRAFVVDESHAAEFRHVFVENGGIGWGTAGFGGIVPVLDQSGREYIARDEGQAIATAYAQLERENWAVAHVVLMKMFDPCAIVRLPHESADDPLVVDAGGLEVSFFFDEQGLVYRTAGGAMQASYPTETDQRDVIRAYWTAVLRSLGTTVTVFD